MRKDMIRFNASRCDGVIPVISNIGRGLKGDRGPEGPEGPKGQKGESASTIYVSSTIVDDVEQAGASVVRQGSGEVEILFKIPKGQKGADGINGVDGKDGRDGKDGERGEPGEPGVPGKAGIPVGAVMPYFGSTAPSGWLICDGSEYLKDDYPILYELLKVNDSDKFKVPDLCGRVIAGASSSYPVGYRHGSVSSSYNPAGSVVTSLSGNDVTVTPSGTVGYTTLTANQIPSHTHNYWYRKLASTSNTGETIIACDYSKRKFTEQVSSTGGGQAHNHGFTGNSMTLKAINGGFNLRATSTFSGASGLISTVQPTTHATYIIKATE